MQPLVSRCFIVLITLSQLTCAMVDNHHFYRASNFLPQITEPRLECFTLATIDVLAGHGATRTAHNPCKIDCSKTGIFQIYGLQDLTTLILGVPDLNPTDPAQLAFIELASIPNSDPLFGKLALSGRFSITEVNIIASQNLGSNLFIQAHVPIRVLKFNKVSAQDLTPTENALTVAKTPEWVAAWRQFPTLLAEFGLEIPERYEEKGPGDTTILLGWTYSYVDSPLFDFIDTTLRTGVLTPTGQEQNPNIPIDITPNGYNGHIAIPLGADFAFGLLEWVTLGMHGGVLVFFKTDRTIRIYTDPSQSGLIKLTKVRATIDRGPLWAINGHFRADHFARGLSVLFGYTAAIQRPSTITRAELCDSDALLNPCVANTDCAFLGWKMHTFHFAAEYDFTSYGARWGSRFGLFYNYVLTGTRVFDTNVGGGYVGIDMQWFF